MSSFAFSKKSINEWNAVDIKQWLTSNQLGDCFTVFQDNEIINGKLLCEIDIAQIAVLCRTLSLSKQIRIKKLILRAQQNFQNAQNPIEIADCNWDDVLSDLHTKRACHGKRWTKEHDKQLLQLLEAKKSIEQIAKELQRNINGVQQRIRILESKTKQVLLRRTAPASAAQSTAAVYATNAYGAAAASTVASSSPSRASHYPKRVPIKGRVIVTGAPATGAANTSPRKPNNKPTTVTTASTTASVVKPAPVRRHHSSSPSKYKPKRCQANTKPASRSDDDDDDERTESESESDQSFEQKRIEKTIRFFKKLKFYYRLDKALNKHNLLQVDKHLTQLKTCANCNDVINKRDAKWYDEELRRLKVKYGDAKYVGHDHYELRGKSDSNVKNKKRSKPSEEQRLRNQNVKKRKIVVDLID